MAVLFQPAFGRRGPKHVRGRRGPKHVRGSQASCADRVYFRYSNSATTRAPWARSMPVIHLMIVLVWLVNLQVEVFPVLIVQAQSEGEVAQPPIEEATAQAEESAAAAETEAAGATAPVTEGATGTEAVPSSEAPETEPAAAEGEVLGAEDAAPPEDPAATTTEDEHALTDSGSTTLMTDTASSTATSTPAVEEPKPIEEPFVLQPGVVLSVNGNTLSAAITVENLTCRSCEKVLPELEVLTYYTEWYPNDGPVKDYSQASVHMAKQARSVSDLANGASRDLTWSAEVPSVHYYFVVEVDPQDRHGAYYLFRSEVEI